MTLVVSARIRARLKAHHSTEYVSFPRSPDHHRAGWGVRALSRLFLVVLVVSLVQMNVPSPTAGAAVLGNDYPANLANAPKDSVIDPWKFYNRECTSFVAWRLNNTNGVAFNDFYGGPQWGNASNWGVAARSVGIAVDNTPAVGSVAWNATNGGADGSEGHVAWVANVEANGTVDIEEYNANIVGGYDIRYGLSTASFSGFIHVRDLVATDPSGNPSGNLELAARTSGGVEVVGWAADPNAGNNPVSVQMLVDGTPTGPIGAAALPRSDVGPHGFDFKVGLDGSPHRICVVAYNAGVGTGNTVLPGCRDVPGAPTTSPPPTVTVGTLGAPVVGMAATPDGGGYWLADAAGGVSPHGDAVSFGLMAGQALNSPIAHIVATPDGKGYWLVAGDGGTFAFGDASFYGSMGGQRLNAHVVDLAPTKDGKGYWLVASDGGIFAFGDATFLGSMGGAHLNKPVVGIATTDGGGYWLVATDGGIFSFGDAHFYGSTGAIALNKPVNGMAPTADGKGYWLVASDGGIFAFGDAAFHGSTGTTPPATPVVGMASNQTSSSPGYWLVDAAGQVFSYNAGYFGGD